MKDTKIPILGTERANGKKKKKVLKDVRPKLHLKNGFFDPMSSKVKKAQSAEIRDSRCVCKIV